MSTKNVYPHSEISISGADERKGKSNKYIADRFFPVRKMPCSAKDLFNDHLEWMEDEENDDEAGKRSEKRGMTVQDVYKMGVLGEGNPFKDHDIETFSN